MAIHDSYSRLVSWLKVLLPLMALGILSVVFLIARGVDPAQELRYADVDITELADLQMIRNPRYFGVTSNGAAIRLSAESALPDMARPGSATPERIRGHEARAEIDIPDGDRINVLAGGLDLDVSENLATFSGGVRIESSSGFVLLAEAVRLALDAAQMSSDIPMTFSAPIGRIAADSFQMKEKGGDTSDFVLVFRGGVTMLFDPRK